MTRSSIQAGKAVILVDVVDKASASFRGITNRITQISKGLSNLGTNAAGGAFLSGFAVKGIVNNFISFEDKILNLTAKLGYFGIASKKQDMVIKDLTKTIIDLGMVTSYTSAEVADAAIALAQAGFTTDELKGSLKGVLDLARGTGYSLGEAGDLMANAIRTFNLFSKDDSYEQRMQKVNYISSMFVKATRLGTVEIQDLRESLKYVGGTANNLGGSLATVLGFLVQASESGLKASLAGTSMGTALQNLVNNLEQLQAQLPSFQMFFEIAEDGTKKLDFAATFKSLTQLTNKMDVISKVKLFQDIFNIRGARFVSSIQEMENVARFIKEIAGAGNESQLAAATMESGLGGALRRTTSAFEALNIAVGYVFKDSGKAFLNFTTILVERLKNVVDQHKGFIALLILSPGILAATAVGALGLSFALNRVVQVLRLLSPLVKGVQFLGGSVTGTFSQIQQGIKASSAVKAGKLAAYRKSQEAVLRAQLSVDKALATAAAKKTAESQAKATAKVMAGPKVQRLAEAKQSMLSAGIKAGMLSPEQVQKAKGPGVISRILTARAERREIQSQIKLEKILSEQQVRKNKLALDKVVDTPVKEAERIGKTVEYQKASIHYKREGVRLDQKAKDAQQGLDTLKSRAANATKAREMAMMNARHERFNLGAEEAIAPENMRKKTPAQKKERTAQIERNKRRMQLDNFISTESGKQARVAERIAAAEKRVAAIKNASLKATKLSTTYAGRAKRVVDQIGVAERINFTNSIKRTAIISRSTAQGAASAARISRAGTALRSASFGRALFGGASFAKIFTGIASGAKTVATLAVSFTRLTMSVSRFVFSWNFVGLAINALLLFGNRIPVIANAFKALGDGLGSAFGELGKIANYAGPAIKVFTLAFQAFQDGNGELGMQALAAGFSGLVDIIQNQLTAAWNAFLEKTMHIWNFFNQIWVIVKNIGAALFEGIVQNFGMLFGSLTEKLGPIAELFTGGGGSIAAVVTGIATGIIAAINFISSLFVKLQYWTDNFIVNLKLAFADIIGSIPGMGKAGEKIRIEAETDNYAAQGRRNDALFAIKQGGDKQQKEIVDALKTSAEELSTVATLEKSKANSRSEQTSRRLLESSAYIEQVLAQGAAQRQAQQDLLASEQMQQGTRRGTTPGAGGISEAAKMFQFKLDNVVSSIQNVNNKALKDTSTQLEEQQTTNKKLDQLISVVKTQGM